MQILRSTLDTLDSARERSAAIAVGFSGGKDSLAVLDLCVRTFERVEPFHMYLVPGLRVVEERIAIARVRYGLTVRQYPHFITRDAMVAGIYCNNHYSNDSLPSYALRDIYDAVKKDANVDLIATGMKKSDGPWRRMQFGNMKAWHDVIYPIADWSMRDVFAFLKARQIEPPKQEKRACGGVDLTVPSLLWLHDNYPDDFGRVCEVFPYAEAVVWRRRFYGDES